MTILSFKPKRRGGGRGARERHIVFKLKAQLLFPRQVSLPPPCAGGRRPSDGIVIHQGPVTAAEGLTPPTARHRTEKVTPARAVGAAPAPSPPSSILQPSPLSLSLAGLSLPPSPLTLDSFLPSSPWLSSPSALHHPSSAPGQWGTHKPAHPKGKARRRG